MAGRWVGVALTLVGVVAVLVLAATGRLTLYVHPRYVVFTVVMTLVAGVAATAAAVIGPGTDHPGHDHGPHEHTQPERAQPAAGTPVRGLARAGAALVLGGRLVAVAAAVVALLVLPPTGLSGSLRQDRDLDSSASAPEVSTSRSLVGGDPSSFSVKDWSVLLRRGDPLTLVGKPVRVSGYVIDKQDGSELWVGRLLITCCAVDARPVGVPVSLPGWHDRFAPDDWVELTGTFVANPDPGSTQPVVVRVTSMAKVAEPSQQYVY